MEGSQGKAASVKFVSASSSNSKNSLVIGGILFIVIAAVVGFFVVNSTQTSKSEADFTTSSCQTDGGVVWPGETCPEGTTQIGTIIGGTDAGGGTGTGGTIGGDLIGDGKDAGGTVTGSQLCCRAIPTSPIGNNPSTPPSSPPDIPSSGPSSTAAPSSEPSLPLGGPTVTSPVVSDVPDEPGTPNNACIQQTINVRMTCPQCSQ